MSRPTIEGAGVRLKRAFGSDEVPLFDPFLLLDDFHSSKPEDYVAGFPWHPHRGIETITYMLSGEVDHGDSLGNAGVIRSGEVQWMTAGSGIIHQEMPRRQQGEFRGFQLWANLPASHKMMPPRYRDITKRQIPELTPPNGVRIRVISGEVDGVRGPVTDIVTDPEYLDVTVPPTTEFVRPIKRGHTAFAYVVEGSASFAPTHRRPLGADQLILFTDGDELRIATKTTATRFLLVSGRPIGEPIAWSGPIVMNTDEELEVAFQEYRTGTFIQHH
jgi:redox-sensitive bicupin YhaK (pirin superfamily)